MIFKEFYEFFYCLMCCNYCFLVFFYLLFDRFFWMLLNYVRNIFDSWCFWYLVMFVCFLRFDLVSCLENVSGIVVIVGNILIFLWKFVVFLSLFIFCWLVIVGFLCIDCDVYDVCIINISYRKYFVMRFIL